MDPKIVLVALNGLENILRLGQADAQNTDDGQNPYAMMIEECRGKFTLKLKKKWYS